MNPNPYANLGRQMSDDDYIAMLERKLAAANARIAELEKDNAIYKLLTDTLQKERLKC